MSNLLSVIFPNELDFHFHRYIFQIKRFFIMALLSEVALRLADQLKLTESTVKNHARVLREAGLLSQKGRGRGAAHATPLDGARLLLALMLMPKYENSDRAPEVVRDFSHLVFANKRWASPEAKKKFGGINIDKLFGLKGEHSFVDALEALMTIMGTDEYHETWPSDAAIFCTVYCSKLVAELNIGGAIYQYALSPDKPASRQNHEIYYRYIGGLQIVTTVAHPHILPIAELISGRSDAA